jgi:hypothetical protein
MLTQKQTIFGPTNGNCFPTCIANLLEVPVWEVPNFYSVYPKELWSTKIEEYLAGYNRFSITLPFDQSFTYNDLWIATGLSPRFAAFHSVIYLGKELAHDPHPDNTGLLGGPKWATILYSSIH